MNIIIAQGGVYFNAINGAALGARVVILNAKEHEPTRKGAERFNRIYFFVFVWPEKITETG
jgi:hypothetical protein